MDTVARASDRGGAWLAAGLAAGLIGERLAQTAAWSQQGMFLYVCCGLAVVAGLSSLWSP